MQKNQHNILDCIKEHGYTGINQKSKVRYLSKGINTTSLDSVKTCIMSDESMLQDFYGCVTSYKGFVKRSSADNRQLLFNAASSKNGAGGNISVTFSPKVWYYESNEWYELSNIDKYKVIKAHSRINVGKKYSKSELHPSQV